MTRDPMVFRGKFPNHTLFKNCVDTWTVENGHALSSRYVKFAEALGVGGHVIQRVIYGDTDSRKANESLRLSVALAQKAEDLLGQPRGTFGGVEDSFPEDGLKSFEPAPTLELAESVSVPEPAPRQSKSHTVLSVTGADLEEPSKDRVDAGWRLLPLDKLGEWGRALLGLLNPFFKEKAIANQIPVLVEHAVNFDSIVITVPVPHGEKKSVVLPAAPLKALIESCPVISGQDAIFMITEMYMSFTAQRMDEVKSKALGKAALQDQLASLRQHIGDLDTIIGSMGPLGVSLRDVEHDVSQALGCDHPAATDLLALLDSYDTLRQEFRSLLRLIQGHVTK